jgi:hypothetical protein
MTEAEKQANRVRVARWREKHIESASGERERLQIVLEAGTKARLEKIAAHYGYRSITALIEGWAKQTASDIDEDTEKKAKKKIIDNYKRNA